MHRNLPWARMVACAAIAGLVCAPAARAQVYRCTAANGHVSFQDHACPAGQQQKVMDVPATAPAGYVPPPPATAPAPPLRDEPLPPPPLPAAPPPLPTMYACVGAVNGKSYLTRNPPPPYLAPLGVLGYPPQTLSQAYGAPGGAGMSAPELSQPPIGGPPIATGMTEVQDYCLPATHAQVCGFVQKQYDENQRRLQMAMRREQPPLEARAQQLEAQLRNCR